MLGDVAYCWPKTLLVPRAKVVYFDLGHWISLAKVGADHPGGDEYALILDECTRAVDDGRAVFPLTATTYMEVAKISSLRQKRDLRHVIERLSRFIVVIPLSTIQRHEIEAMLDQLIGPRPKPVRTMKYLDWGVSRAFGYDGTLRMYDRDGQDVTEDARLRFPDGPEAFDKFFEDAQLDLNRSILDGPTKDEEPHLTELGWNQYAGDEVQRRRVDLESGLARQLDELGRWRRGRLRDVVTANEICKEVNEILTDGLAERNVEIEDILGPSPQARRTLDMMPSFDVTVTLKTSLHRNANHEWRANDIYDIDALAATMPYCDIVVTDRAMKSHIERFGLHDRLSTAVLSDLSQLPQMF